MKCINCGEIVLNLEQCSNCGVNQEEYIFENLNELSLIQIFSYIFQSNLFTGNIKNLKAAFNDFLVNYETENNILQLILTKDFILKLENLCNDDAIRFLNIETQRINREYMINKEHIHSLIKSLIISINPNLYLEDTNSPNSNKEFTFFKDESLIRELELYFNSNIKDLPLKRITNTMKLELSNKGIESIEGIEQFKNLVEIDISYNPIKDITNLFKIQSLKKINVKNAYLDELSFLYLRAYLHKIDITFDKELFRLNENELKFYSLTQHSDIPNNQYIIGKHYYDGNIVKSDHSTALKWFARASEANHPDALYMIGHYFETGNGLNINKPKALELYKKAAALGNKEAKKKINKLDRQIYKESQMLQTLKQTSNNSKTISNDNLSKRVLLAVYNFFFRYVNIATVGWKSFKHEITIGNYISFAILTLFCIPAFISAPFEQEGFLFNLIVYPISYALVYAIMVFIIAVPIRFGKIIISFVLKLSNN